MTTEVKKVRWTKSILIFFSALLVAITIFPIGMVSAAEESDLPEITTVTNSERYLKSLTKQNESLKEEIKELSTQGYQLNDESLMIEDVKILIYSNADETTQGFIQVRDNEYTVLEASINADGTYKSSFLKDTDGKKVSLDANDEITTEIENNGEMATFRVDPGMNAKICSILMNASGTAITAIYAQVLAAVGTGPLGMAAYFTLMTLGWGYLSAFC